MAATATAPAAPAQQKNDKPDVPETKPVQQQVPVQDILNKINMSPSDRYQIRREITLGGNGACKVAFDQLAEREVVLKLSGQGQGTWAAERIIKEARTAARFNHANVTRLLELGAFAGKDQVFMTTPYVDGTSLDQIFKKLSEAAIPGLIGYSMTAIAELFDRVCAGVEHMHANTVLHLDLKPQNVVVGGRGEVVVVDFGVSQLLNGDFPRRFATSEGTSPSLTSTLIGSVPGDNNIRAVGTPAFMSPEQWAGDPGTFTERTDVYGLGGVLFFLLTGTAPNQVQRPTDLEPYFRHSPVPSPSDFTRRRVPPELEALCVKCLSRDPAQRFPSVFHVRHVLKSWLSRPEMWELYRTSANY